MSTPQRIPNFPLENPEQVPAWDFVQKWIPGEWTLVGEDGSAFGANWTGIIGSTDLPMWRRVGDEVELKGKIYHTSLSFASFLSPMLTLPTTMLPPPGPVLSDYNLSAMAQDVAPVSFGVELRWIAGLCRLDYQRYFPGYTPGNFGYISLTNLRLPLI